MDKEKKIIYKYICNIYIDIYKLFTHRYVVIGNFSALGARALSRGQAIACGTCFFCSSSRPQPFFAFFLYREPQPNVNAHVQNEYDAGERGDARR
jgi:hypothetical protein